MSKIEEDIVVIIETSDVSSANSIAEFTKRIPTSGVDENVIEAGRIC